LAARTPSYGGDGERPIGEIVSDLSEKASLLVREEIELAKAEMEQKARRLARGAVAGAVAGFFVLLALILFLHGAAWGVNDVLDSLWLGFVIVGGTLLLLAALGGLFAARSFKAATPPVPERAIEEAKLIREAVEHPQVQAATAARAEAVTRTEERE
jgi:hypothetical protein